MPPVAVVVPCYNEARRLQQETFVAWLDVDPDCHFCFVDDGSGDGTGEVLQRLRARSPERISVLALPENRGKAEAVRQGVLHAAASGRFAYVAYWDADLATPLRELPRMMRVIEAHDTAVLVMGSRWRRLGSAIERSGVRHALGRVFATGASLGLDLPVYDSQCGAKLIRTAAVPWLFDEPFSTRWLFDVEILARLRNRLGRSRALETVIEVPLDEWYETGGSKIGARDMIRVPLEMLEIRRRYGRSGSAPA
jgi:glycosyltransferase involved in cell wall biosynthesis